MNAKRKEIEALSTTIESKTSQVGELGVQIVKMKEDKIDTKAALQADQQMLKELTRSCAKKTAEWEHRSKLRAEELVAIGDTIKVLNDDDALELFKKTLPSPASSFLQVQDAAPAVQTRALAAVRAAQRQAVQQEDR